MIFIGVGANLPSAWGAPPATFAAAEAMLAAAGVRLIRTSPLYLSLAERRASPRLMRTGGGTGDNGDNGGGCYHNAVWQVASGLSPRGLLQVLHAVEARCGRRAQRGARQFAPRPLDLDLLAWGRLCQPGPPHLPHPAAHRRGFVLYPLRDIAPGWHHPVSGRSLAQLLAALPPLARPHRVRN